MSIEAIGSTYDLQLYINMLEKFLIDNKSGSITFFIQNEKITGVDIVEKQRNDTYKQYKDDL